MKKLLIVLLALLSVVLIALGVVFIFPEIEDWLLESSRKSSSQTSGHIDTATPSIRPDSDDINHQQATLENNDNSDPYITKVIAGYNETAIIYSNGAATLLADNDIFIHDEPSLLVSMSGGMLHAVALYSDGTVAASTSSANFEDTNIGQYDVDEWTDIVAVSAGFLHTVGLRSDGTVVATKFNDPDFDDGQCNVDGWSDIIEIGAGYDHTIGLRSDGSVVAVGSNEYGQCNVDNWTDIVAICAGRFYTVGLRSDGKVIAVGIPDYGQCNVDGWTDIVAISAGFMHTVGLRSNGTVVATELSATAKNGGFDNGQCDVSGWTDIVAISAGYTHTVGLRSDGVVVAVGDNEYGQCNVDALYTDYGNTTGDISAEGTESSHPNQYESAKFENFLSQLQYPTGPFSLEESYSATEIESISIIEIENSISKSGCVNITFEIIGTVWNSDLFFINVDCFDAEGYNIGSSILSCQVSDGSKFKIREEALQIPLETVRIEFTV